MQQRHRELTDAYGFGLFPLPVYRPASRGAWRIGTYMPSLGDGYLGTAAVESRAVLTRGREVWMSTGLLERESHAWHVHCARGTVVTVGLGMGMYVYAAAMKPGVDRVIAAEISPDIIALMQQASCFDRWPCRDKVTILEADALADDFPEQVAACTGGRAIDYCYADLWPRLAADEAPAQTARIVHALRPEAAGWWGQELSFGKTCSDAGRSVDEAGLRAYFDDIGIPAPLVTAGYAAFCRDVMAAHGIGVKKSFWQRLRHG